MPAARSCRMASTSARRASTRGWYRCPLGRVTGPVVGAAVAVVIGVVAALGLGRSRGARAAAVLEAGERAAAAAERVHVGAGRVEIVDGANLFRIDFVASARLRDPDVDGAIYLDPVNFHIRRAFLHLSKIPKSVHGLAGVEVTTVFGEIFPSVPLIAAVSSVNHFANNSDRADAPTQAIEEQRLIAVNFLKTRPGAEVKKPPN